MWTRGMKVLPSRYVEDSAVTQPTNGALKQRGGAGAGRDNPSWCQGLEWKAVSSHEFLSTYWGQVSCSGLRAQWHFLQWNTQLTLRHICRTSKCTSLLLPLCRDTCAYSGLFQYFPNKHPGTEKAGTSKDFQLHEHNSARPPGRPEWKMGKNRTQVMSSSAHMVHAQGWQPSACLAAGQRPRAFPRGTQGGQRVWYRGWPRSPTKKGELVGTQRSFLIQSDGWVRPAAQIVTSGSRSAREVWEQHSRCQ